MCVKKLVLIYLMLFGLIINILGIVEVSALDESKPLRVGFIQGDGFHTMEVNGGYSGYNYDYLMKVAQYTGWEYEFVVINDTATHSAEEVARAMLEDGELDLLGSMYKTEENLDRFEFGEKNYGVSRHILCTLGNNNRVTTNTFFLQDSLSVALVENDELSIAAFEAIFQYRDVEIEYHYVENNDQALDLIKSEQVDLIMSTNVSPYSNILATLVEISPTPFFFASTNGNETLMLKLDEAIQKIEFNEFTIQDQLVEQYFGLLHTGVIILTKEEEEALKGYDYLTVGLLKGREPYQFYQEGDIPSGISVEILEEISDIIGVKFKYVWLEDREDMKNKIASREIDICSTVPFDPDYELTYFFNVILTQPYLSNAVSWIHSSRENNETLPHYYYIADNIPFYPDDELTEVYDIEQTILDLEKYGEISLFADPNMAQYIIQKSGITNVEIQNITSMSSKICFGVGKHLDSVVVGLINHAILHLDPFVVDDIIYRNTTVQNEITLKAFFRENALGIISIVVLFFSLIVFTLYYYTKKFKNLSRQDSLTKLYNAGYFHNYAGDKTRKLSNGCLILVDIDYFKQVNDNHGHQMGDKIIIEVANKLKQICGKLGTVARLGGDEFVVLIESKCDVVDLNQKCEIILKELIQNETGIPVTLSMGGFVFTKGTPYDDLYRLADEVLYEVKEKGRNSYMFSSDNTSFDYDD